MYIYKIKEKAKSKDHIYYKENSYKLSIDKRRVSLDF